MTWKQIGIIAVLAIWSTQVEPAHAQQYGTATDSAAIRGIVADFDSAWAQGDAARWATHYAPDADFVNILGMVMTDRMAMQARHRDIFMGVFKGSKHSGTIRRIRFLGPATVIVDVDLEVTDFKVLPPGSQPTVPGVLRTRMKHVMTKSGAEWQIVASQNAAVAPMPQK